MTVDDLAGCRDVFGSSFGALRAQVGLAPVHGWHALTSARIARLLDHDPEGAHVALDEEGELVGFAQAGVRDDTWILVHLFVEPGRQGRGIGAALLDAAVRTAAGCPKGMIGSTPDPRAIHRYARLPGFELHPALSVFGRITTPLPRPRATVREATLAELELAPAIDRRLGRGAHGDDLVHLVDGGNVALVVEERGYALATPGGPALLAALDEDAATALLGACLEHVPPGGDVEFGRVTGDQRWALRLLVDAGLDLRPWGPFVLRGLPAPTPYLPHPALC